VLEGVNLEEQIRTFIDDVVAGFVGGALDEFAEEWDLEQLWTDLKQFWPVSISHKDLVEDAGSQAALHREELIEKLKADAHAAYDAREEEVGEEVMRELERRVLLSVLDRKWREHLYEMDYLREGIYLRAYSQRDPLVEYQREGYDMFAAMMDGIKEETVGFLFNLEVQVEEEPEEQEFHYHPDGSRHAGPMHEGALAEPPVGVGAAGPALGEISDALKAASPKVRAKGLEPVAKPTNLSYSAPDETGHEEVRTGGTVTRGDDDFAGVSRNALCPCGSGKKFKRCHGAPGGPTGTTARVS
jgi:preprotein translocase subunit SecA